MKKGQGLPVNVIVMMILGLILFSLGMALFFNISSSSEASVEDLNNRVENNIKSLECSGEDWICTPSYEIRNGDNEVFEIFVANKATTSQKYSIEFNNLDPIDTKFGITNDCGSIIISYPDIDVNVLSGESASFPFQVTASRVRESDCGFVGSVSLLDESGDEVDKTPVIVRVE